MAVTAESVIVELEARTGKFDASIRTAANGFNNSMSSVERSATDAERTIARSSQSIVRSSGQVGQATRNLGFQISDVGAQLSGGQSPFVIFGQQAPQFAQAFDEIARAGAGVGTVLRSIALPGILAVISVLATLIEKHYQAADATGAHKKATDELQEAVDRLTGASARNNRQTEIGISLDLRAAEAKRQNAIRTRQLIEAELRKQQSNLSAAQVTEETPGTTFGIPGRGSASRKANIDDVNRQLRDNATAIKEYDRAIASGKAQLILRGVTAQTDKAAAATQRYDDTLVRLRLRFERGAIDGKTFERLALATTRQRDAALATTRATEGASTASRGHSVDLRVQSTAARDAASAQRELEQALTGLIRKYDPAAAAAADYAAELQKIADLEKAGALTPDRAATFKEGAASNFRKARADVFNLDSVEEMRPQAAADEKAADDAAKADKQAKDDAEKEVQATREANVRSLANLYEDLFTEGGGRAWDNFKRDGLRAIAVVLAQATISSFSEGGGGLGGLLGNLTKAAGSYFGGGGSVPKFASGGSMLVGGRGGVDQNLLSLNGQPIAAVSRGETLSVNPNTRAAGGRGGGATVLQTISVDARGAVMNDQFASQILARADQGARQIVGANNVAARKSLPAAQSRFATLGTTG